MMLSEENVSMLKNKTQEELLEILIFVCNKNQNAAVLLHNILNKKKRSPKRVLTKILRLVDDPTSEYTDIYLLVKDFLETSISDEDMLLVAVESADRFIDELISYDYMHPEELLDRALELYDRALSIASCQSNLQSGQKLYDMIPFDCDGINEEFINIFFMYFDIDENDNVIIYKGL